ncbi:inositol monophosphatase family protein [Microvirga rosea]|uniref:inositol monophosphatase family protein n=1 Tax=Microvirga rosea TaxID=2715425 RepID=UPI001D09D421|nr:inositol monophosphatase family protein [Microvirga rosea]MCB8822777.1 inositol monophosphatase [Microvirga rosea]
MPDDLELRFDAARAIAREAGGLARKRFLERPRSQHADMKGPQDYLTATDAEVEELIRDRLLALFPDDAFYGEEGGGSFKRDVWVVDPIDGTANFARGIPHFAASIAFVRDEKVEIGVILDVMQDELYTARRGGGASLNGKPIRVSGLTDARQATVEAGWSSRLPTEAYLSMVGRLKALGFNVRRAGSGTLGIAYVADGRVDAYCELHLNSWDALAGLLVVEEAGGWVNDFLAKEGLRKGNPVLVCTPGLADAVSAATGIGREPV